jgi:prepilin-type N-terminal cleavage/methylation domain-containing protein
MCTSGASQRRGFTLIELLVVTTLMLVLAGLAVLIIPRVSSDQQATRGAGQLQQWIEGAKQRAARDRAPRGIRLLPGTGPNGPAFVTDLVFLVQADDYYLGSISETLGIAPAYKKTIYSRASLSNNGTNGIVKFDMFDPNTNGVSGKAMPRTLITGQAVQIGDHIVFDNGSTVYLITGVSGPAAGAPGGVLTTSVPFPATMVNYTTMEYRIIRQPRPDGDEPLQLPNNVVIDCTAKNLVPNYDLPALSNPGIDIMFAPDGRVMGPLAGSDKIIFWVRDQTVAGNQADPTLVVVYPRTGLIAAHPVDLTNYNSVTGTNPTPYSFTKSGVRSSQ